MREALVLGAGLSLLACLALLARGCETEPERRAPRPPRAVPEPPPPESEIVPLPPKPKPPPPSPPPEPPPIVEPVEAVKAEQAGGIIRGTVRYLGEPIRRKRIRIGADPKCAELHSGPMRSDAVVVDREGRVKWAFVYVDGGPREAVYRAPKRPVVLDQVRCRYDPHVLGIMKDQPLRIRNRDDLVHNVHVLSFRNREFSVARPYQGVESVHTFTEKEVMVAIKCDIHPWMSAWVGVMDHPYYAVSGDLGQYSIGGLPPGRFQVRLWHEKLAGRLAVVDVPEDGEAILDFNLLERK